MRLTSNRETAEELTLDVFHDVWRRAPSYDAASGTVLGWIMNQARSRAIDRLRFENRKKRSPGDDMQPLAEVAADPCDVLELRGSMTLGTRQQYRDVLGGSPLSQEDAWHRAVEFLFERLAVRWELAGLPLEGQRELLGRYRMASSDERRWVRQTLGEHLGARHPDIEL